MAAAILAIIVDFNDLVDHLFLSSFRGLQDLNLSLNLNPYSHSYSCQYFYYLTIDLMYSY